MRAPVEAMPVLVCARNDWRMRTADGARNKINVSLMFSEHVRRRLMLQQDLLPPLILADDPPWKWDEGYLGLNKHALGYMLCQELWMPAVMDTLLCARWGLSAM